MAAVCSTQSTVSRPRVLAIHPNVLPRLRTNITRKGENEDRSGSAVLVGDEDAVLVDHQAHTDMVRTTTIAHDGMISSVKAPTLVESFGDSRPWTRRHADRTQTPRNMFLGVMRACGSQGQGTHTPRRACGSWRSVLWPRGVSVSARVRVVAETIGADGTARLRPGATEAEARTANEGPHLISTGAMEAAAAVAATPTRARETTGRAATGTDRDDEEHSPEPSSLRTPAM